MYMYLPHIGKSSVREGERKGGERKGGERKGEERKGGREEGESDMMIPPQ